MVVRPFAEGDCFATFRNHLAKVERAIGELENDYVLKASPSELEAYFIDKAHIEPLVIVSDSHYIEEKRATTIDPRAYDDFPYFQFEGPPPAAPATELLVALPYTGDRLLWRLQASVYDLRPTPEIEIADDRVIFSYVFRDDMADPNRIKSAITEHVQALIVGASRVSVDAIAHNERSVHEVREALKRKRDIATRAVSAMEGLGIPMKRREEPLTYVAPATRRKAPVARPAVTAGKFQREPALELEEYEHILQVLRSMALVIERSPGSFAGLQEEDIRTQFLLTLNGHYEGGATGETFNAEGKTDILVRVADRNVFIAECKYWRGPKGFDDAIQQLLGYLSWRDSKAALLIFNRGQQSTAVRTKMHEVMSARPEYRRTVPHSDDGEGRYVFVKRSDPGREILITTMLFDFPTTTDANKT